LNENLSFSQTKLSIWKGMVTMEDRNGTQGKKDLLFEGKDKTYLDIDRIINEGLSGGSVHARHDSTNIEEARELVSEEPPSITE
jgi:hypothetical protein